MKLIRNIKLDNYNFFNDQKTRKIFSRGYEDIMTLIYYQDAQNRFKLVVAKEDDPPLIVEKDITRAQAFRLINTRP
ncbi:hypothetical protein CLV24_103160 [Pontibacter ummariensis]|uniref:Uncharacterized protein n=1 Tax=Pontibacter ummariensis TaxID=1610492 RepID=A0A239CMZ1_9BACT|nr:hypothetical protein [Pontibacter ummariensis]PRY14921.1 hypothetical protein CLV24_103160 [Pontibacter ummariensis]SNS21535.1 hypothetical protein SAMN06296052_103153 [Pontibacter ummariensis]